MVWIVDKLVTRDVEVFHIFFGVVVKCAELRGTLVCVWRVSHIIQIFTKSGIIQGTLKFEIWLTYTFLIHFTALKQPNLIFEILNTFA